MKNLMIIIFFVLFSNCSLSQNSSYWTEDNKKRIVNENKLQTINKKANDITLMTIDEYKIYINEHTKKSKYPNISK